MRYTSAAAFQARLLHARAGHNASVTTIGVIRAYATRFGPGPLVTSDSVFAQQVPELHNEASPWHGEFRAGPLDLISTRYALKACGGVDGLAVNHLDRMGGMRSIRVCTGYEYQGPRRSNLEDFFVVRGDETRILIDDIRVGGDMAEVTKILSTCKPARYESFEGWGSEVPHGGLSTFPPSLAAFLKFIESESGLSTPVRFASFGPRRSDKRVL